MPTPMPATRAADYRKNASDTMKLAQRAACPADRERLLRMAEAWLALADRANEGIAYDPMILHPLVREKLGRW
jgi:hypothetical protein